MARRHPEPETLEEHLNSYTVDTLKKLARLLSSDLPTRKADLVALIQKPMENEKTLQRLWETLDPLQQTAVAEVVHSSSSHFNVEGFKAKYGGAPDWGQMDRYNTMSQPSLLCLFLYGYGKEMPLDLKERLQEFVPAPLAPELQTEDECPAAVSLSWSEYDYHAKQSKTKTKEVPLLHTETERVAQHDFHAVLRLIDTGKVKVGAKTRQVSTASAEAITKVLQGGDFYPPEKKPDPYATDPRPIKAFAWPLILQSAGLASISGTQLQLSPAGKKALTAPASQGIQTAWRRWQKTTLLDEFNRVHTIKGQTGKGKRQMTAVAGRRKIIVETLKACPPGQWVEFAEFSRFMVACDHTFAVTHDPWNLYVSDSQYGSLGYDGYHSWNILEERYMMVFLFEYAATMGLVDIAYIHPSGARDDYGDMWGTDDLDCLSRYDGLIYFRLNGLGAWCLELTQKYASTPLEEQQIIEVRANLDVVATAPIPPGDQLFLEQFAQKTSEAAWKLQSTKLLEALEEGHSIVDIEAFLTAKSGGILPDAVMLFFKDAAERASYLTPLGSALLIEAADPELAQLLANHNRLRALCMPAGERCIVVPAKSEKAFRRALRALGYGLPAQQATPSVTTSGPEKYSPA